MDLLRTLLDHPFRAKRDPFKSLSKPLPYGRKPAPYGPNVSICAKGVSRGVHNIAFLLSPDGFRAFNLVFFTLKPGPSLTKGVWCLENIYERLDVGKKEHSKTSPKEGTGKDRP